MKAVALHQSGRLDEAVACYRNVLAHDPVSAEVHNNLGLALQGQGKLDEAIASYRKALSLNPDFAVAHANLGNALKEQGDLDEAANCYQKAISCNPDFADAYYNLGVVQNAQLRLKEAAASYRSALRYKPDNVAACINLGNVTQQLGEREEAARCYRKAIALRPDWVEAHINLGNVLKDQGRVDAAIDSYRKALWLKPDHAEAHTNLSYTLLMSGAFHQGWREFEWRIKSVSGNSYINDPRNPSRVLSRPSELLPLRLEGKRILFVRDQGLGDELFFLSFARVAQRRGAWTAYCPSAKIATIVQRAPGLDMVISDAGSLSNLDHIFSVADLPLILGMDSVDDIPPTLQLTTLPDRVAAIRERLAVLGTGPFLGVTWRAGIEKKQGGPATPFRETDIPLLARALANWPGEVLILQRNPRPEEIENFMRALGRPAHDFSELNENLEDMLALLSQLDDYVGVSNTNMHLMASLGKTARVLITHPPDWRWMVEGNRSPWFPNFQLYREEPDGNWSAAISRLTEDLHKAKT